MTPESIRRRKLSHLSQGNKFLPERMARRRKNNEAKLAKRDARARAKREADVLAMGEDPAILERIREAREFFEERGVDG